MTHVLAPEAEQDRRGGREPDALEGGTELPRQRRHERYGAIRRYGEDDRARAPERGGRLDDEGAPVAHETHDRRLLCRLAPGGIFSTSAVTRSPMPFLSATNPAAPPCVRAA